VPTVQVCPACRTGVLARRGGDPLCPTCMKAAREMPSQPTWLFDSPLLRQALAEVNLPAVPAIVRAACGVSQRDIAAMAGWSQAALSYYERGVRDGMYDIRTALQFADAVGMPRTALLPLVFADAEVSWISGSGDCMSTELPSTHGFDGLGTAARLSAAPPAVSAPRQVTGSHIRYWQACSDTLYARDRCVGGTILLPLALQQWRRARLAARDPGAGGTASQLLAEAGELALCTGWIALDAGQLALARPLYEEAGELAAGSGNAMLSVHVLTARWGDPRGVQPDRPVTAKQPGISRAGKTSLTYSIGSGSWTVPGWIRDHRTAPRRPASDRGDPGGLYWLRTGLPV
jgi:transcriptional regulator with XRE-family HTH domain